MSSSVLRATASHAPRASQRLTLAALALSALSLSACTEPNITYEACQQRPYACSEVELCDGIDGDGDGVIDEGLSEPCVLFLSQYLSGGEGFGRAVASFSDLNDDGREELLVGATAPMPPLGQPGLAEARGSIYLLDGESFMPLWSSEKAGAFGAQLAVGDFDGDGEREFVTSSPFEGDEGLVGLWFYKASADEVSLYARYLPDDPLGFGRSLSVTKAHSSAQGFELGDALLTSQPLWSTGDMFERGRLTAIRLEDTRAVVDHEREGWRENQRLGESLASVLDTTGDGAPEVLATSWREEGTREVLLLDNVNNERLKSFVTQEDTQGSLGEGLTWGRFGADDEGVLAFSAPQIAPSSPEEPTKGRVYMVTPGGNSLGITGVEGQAYGSALLTLRREGEPDLLLVAGRGFLRVLGPNNQVIKDLTLNSDEVPSLAASSLPDEHGRYRVLVGLPSQGRVYVLTVK